MVFVDEIDSTIGLPFAADFFAAVRACYNARAEDETFERLSFVLLGVATPDQLIDDPERTPFNVGQRVELTDFTHEEARRLAAGLDGHGHGEETLGRILHWTGGQPYLTQVLCQLMAETGGEGESAVDRAVAEHFLAERALREETHLRHIRARLCGRGDGARRRLKLYRRILRGRKPVADEPTSPVMAALKLSGVVRPLGDGTLAPRNRLYERVFTVAWARREMPADRARTAVAGSLSATAAAFLFWYAVFQPRPYVEQLELASEDYAVAAAAYESLRANPFARFRADELLARFWDRRARQAALGADRDRVLLTWLQALRTSESDRRRREAGHWIGDSYESLRATVRHGGEVNALAFSPDGERVVTGTYDGTARLWSGESGAALGQPMRHESRVLAVAFSPDGQAVVTRTSSRVHVHAVTASGLEHVASHFIGTGLMGAYRFTEACSDCLDVAVRPTVNSLRIDRLRLREPGGPPVEGDPGELLEEWQRRLALVFDAQMNLVPRYPVAGGTPREHEKPKLRVH